MGDVIWLSLKYVSKYQICIYMGAKFSSIFRIPWSHQSTSLSYLTFKNTVFIHYMNQHNHEIHLKINDYPQNPPPLLNLNHSIVHVTDLTLENLRQVSPLHCLSFCYICQSVSLFVHASYLYSAHKQYCCQAVCLRIWVTKFCLLCLSVHLCVCLSLYVCIFFNTAADCYRTIWLWAT